MKPIVFLHLPKTAGQTIHHALGTICGEEKIAPFRLQSQVSGPTSFPRGYVLHSGHLHWDGLEAILPQPFSFSVIRDPRERFASFYFYMRKKIQDQVASGNPVRNHGIHVALTEPVECFFFNQDTDLSVRIRLAWANRTLTYFALRKLERRKEDQRLELDDLITAALLNAEQLSAIYDFEDLSPLEADIEQLWGQRPDIVSQNTNKGPLQHGVSRWASLLDELGSDRLARGMERFVDEDEIFLGKLRAQGGGRDGRIVGTGVVPS